jgi:hypothetical protein
MEERLIGEFRCASSCGTTAHMSAALKVGKQVQEQTQIIATAIGRPMTKAPTIINVNSESKFIPGRAFSTNADFSAADFELKYR